MGTWGVETRPESLPTLPPRDLQSDGTVSAWVRGTGLGRGKRVDSGSARKATADILGPHKAGRDKEAWPAEGSWGKGMEMRRCWSVRGVLSGCKKGRGQGGERQGCRSDTTGVDSEWQNGVIE